jgi:hypothetical protein
LAEGVREISRPREDAGTRAEPDVFVATACAVVTAVTKPAGGVTEIIASEIASPPKSWFSSPSELHRPTQAVAGVQRYGVQRRRASAVRCNALFDGRTTNPRNFSDQADPISHQRRDPTTLAASATTIAHRKPASQG